MLTVSDIIAKRRERWQQYGDIEYDRKLVEASVLWINVFTVNSAEYPDGISAYRNACSLAYSSERRIQASVRKIISI